MRRLVPLLAVSLAFGDYCRPVVGVAEVGTGGISLAVVAQHAGEQRLLFDSEKRMILLVADNGSLQVDARELDATQLNTQTLGQYARPFLG